ncbi:MAG: phenylacetic acid degradation b [Anaerolineae bacterium]|nr:phenylacetic acid degradation b [Anaerolineae bacterium]
MAIQYDVFARKAHPEFLEQIGSVEVAEAADVRQAMLAAFGPEQAWLEMLAVPRQAVITVFSEQQEMAQ